MLAVGFGYIALCCFVLYSSTLPVLYFTLMCPFLFTELPCVGNLAECLHKTLLPQAVEESKRGNQRSSNILCRMPPLYHRICLRHFPQLTHQLRLRRARTPTDACHAHNLSIHHLPESFGATDQPRNTV